MARLCRGNGLTCPINHCTQHLLFRSQLMTSCDHISGHVTTFISFVILSLHWTSWWGICFHFRMLLEINRANNWISIAENIYVIVICDTSQSPMALILPTYLPNTVMSSHPSRWRNGTTENSDVSLLFSLVILLKLLIAQQTRPGIYFASHHY